ncbi:MAG: error-prone DNA polymerase, partial [Actinobacteria bacterium]|nr:error-prone DNA polymerase [Actinomycetota bacterium]
QRGILARGGGSAANSVVCYVLGVTAVDPIRYGLLFERFLSAERDGPPDIDIDIESGRREEVIQYVYAKHGREHAAQVANVITYRARSAVRDVAKALGYAQGQQDAWAKQVSQWSTTVTDDEAEGMPAVVVELADELADAPRHLGIHSGGMVICDQPIIEVCPVEWGRMPGRSVLQWDKDDCAAIGLTKFDLLGLGMLSALRYTFEMVQAHHGVQLELHSIPADDPLVYDMLWEADTVGVFQIESRAQQATLPRLRPRTFHDLAIEIALIRPGPIQGQAVHPYLRRRNGQEPVRYPHPDLEPYLAKTLGVPLFQEQLMQVAITAAGFTPGEADQLRRAMGSKRSTAKMEAMRERLYAGLSANSITGKDADDIWEGIKGFAHFGFPESHSISFAYLALASSWLKLYYPAAFLAGLIRAQP